MKKWNTLLVFLLSVGSVVDTTLVACSFTPCSQFFMSGSTYGDLRLWDLNMNQLLAEKDAHDLGVTCCKFAPDILAGGRVTVTLRPSQYTILKVHFEASKISPATVHAKTCCSTYGDSDTLVSLVIIIRQLRIHLFVINR